MSQDPDPSLPPSDDELRELIKNATGGFRTVDFTGCIRFGDGEAAGKTLCAGYDDDVNWHSEVDKQFTVRVTPYVLHLLLIERDYYKQASRAKSILLKKHGIDPNGIIEIMDEASFKHSV